MKVVTFGAEGSARAVSGPVMLFLHGFPSVRSRQNRDIAEQTAKRVLGQSHVPLYAGLGNAPGVFRFGECLEDVRAYFTKLSDEASRPIDLVGHSWGGFLALKLAADFPERVRRLVLLSPLLDFNAIGDIREGFSQEHLQHPQLSLGSIDELAEDFLALAARQSIVELVSLLPKHIDILFLQAQEDPVTTVPVARAMQAKFASRPEYHEVPVNHSFLGEARAAIADQIADFVIRTGCE